MACMIALLSGACGGGSTSSVSRYDSVVTEIPDDDGKGGPEEEFVDDDEEEYIDTPEDETDFQLAGIMETCRHCNGYGIVQDGLYGVAHYCLFCGGQRVVDAAINTLPDDFFEQMANGDGGTTYNDDMDREQIMREIERLEEDIWQMEHQLEYIESDMQRSYLQQQIISARYEVERLRRMLNVKRILKLLEVVPDTN